MALTREMALRGLRQATIEVLTAGVYGAPKDVYSVQTLQVQENHSSSKMPGNDRVKDSYGKLVDLDVTMAFGMDLDTLAQMTGNSIADAGSTPNQVATLTRNAGAQAPYFRLKGRVAYIGQGEAGGYVATFPLCKLTGINWAHEQDNYVTVSASINIIPDPTTEDVYTLTKMETDAALSTTADTTAPTVTLSPVDGATGVATSVYPTWTFNEAVQKNSYAFSLHLLTSITNTSPVAGTVTFSADGLVATFVPSAALTGGAAYQMVARGVRDLAGNVMAETIGNFTCA